MKNQRNIREDVVFRVFRSGNDVIALWPAVLDSKYTCQCYQYIGQHGAADYDQVVAITRLATPEEYADLLNELKRIGYTPYVIKRRSSLHR